jgi:hypothetical protein
MPFGGKDAKGKEKNNPEWVAKYIYSQGQYNRIQVRRV